MHLDGSNRMEQGVSAGKILVGTSGYFYSDWVGHFYPEHLKKEEFLGYYANHFNAVEINYTYYKMPTAKSLEKMAKRVAGKVEFVLKLHSDMTHSRTADSGSFRDFTDACKPLEERGVMGALLAQFPYSFHKTAVNEDYLHRLKEMLPNKDIVVELRNVQWIKQDTFSLLKEMDFGYCCVDEPNIKGLMPNLAVATSQMGYVRFHGRNHEKWYNNDRPEERYDYRYSKEELESWVPKIIRLADMTRKVYCFANNHYQSKSVDSAQLLIDLLKKGAQAT